MEIQLNGKKIHTSCTTAFGLKREGEIVILNGYQLSGDMPLAQGDTVCVIAKGVMPKEAELEAMLMARHTPHVHEKLKQGKVAIAGLGGLGSNIAIQLARIGVGELRLVDFDVVEPSNLNRQQYHMGHLGLHKTQAMKEQIAQINPFCKVELCTKKVSPENALALFADYPIICEAFDDPQAKAMLVSLMLGDGKKVIGASGMAGYGSANEIQTTRSMKNLYVCGDLVSEAQPFMGLMAPRVAICAGHQANMVLRILLNLDEV